MLLPLEEYDESNISLDLDENDEGDQEVLLTSSDNASSFPPLPQEGTLISWWSNNFSLLEISGSCGDFGTLIPLLVAGVGPFLLALGTSGRTVTSFTPKPTPPSVTG